MARQLNFGVIGSGYMGKAYAIALRALPTVFRLPAEPICDMLATTSAGRAAEQARELGFRRSTGNWRELVEDPAIDVVAICSPTYMHREMALAAIAAGKHVICEKPLALSSAECAEMADAADRAGVCTLVGYNYIKNPATALARQLIEAGEIGEIVHFRGTHNEDFLMDPGLPMSWRLRKAFASEAGALGDLASHIINAAHFLCGPVAEVIGESQIIHAQRPNTAGVLEAVENDDQTQFLLRFESGVMGSIEASRIAAGRKMGLTYEIVGTRGTLLFDQERLAELKYYRADDPPHLQGFRTILIGPEHPDYGHFCIGTGHGFGYNDMIMVEMRDLVEGICGERPLWPRFRDAVHTAEVVDAVGRSQRERRWVKVGESE
ncbi:myo-inositol 2-dehydrogenase [Marinobacterium nitratireducens]|uniref:Myo-inositol 2-dehydrogenase n=1 Tax=Marinobacterium nitratireducens TaxID=518897 RepID=A0A917ZJV1_9GAMM|nr:Gfo/Idh/MocA family oxidoreductase [Marinobacterium nitratireducens]GGO84490.1 myo-inositol 2-dehydrogenase [Marinobacterium nitratireducens]